MDDGVPAGFEGLDAVAQLRVLAFARGFDGAVFVCVAQSGETHGRTEGAVLGLKLSYSMLKSGKLRLPAIARVLGSDAVTMSARLLSLFGA